MTTPQSFLSDKEYIEEKHTICYKNIPHLKTERILILQDFLNRISVLKLEFCNLTAHQIEVLANILVGNESVIEVSVNGNPNTEQNFYLLLHETNIISLSLKYCSIDSKGIEKISNELYRFNENPLIHLNLSSNSIGNEGIKHIVRFLRINRILISLNLADNKIYDKGLLQLIIPLQMFPLNIEEIVIRWRMKFEIQRKNMGSNHEVPLNKTISKDNGLIPNESKDFSQLSVNKSKTISPAKVRVSHPFMWDNYEESQDIYCPGNDTLINLNLSYNRLTSRSLMSILQMLEYQIHNYSYDKGISRISTAGNDFNNCEHILELIKVLLASNKKKSIMGGKRRSYIHSRKRS